MLKLFKGGAWFESRFIRYNIYAALRNSEFIDVKTTPDWVNYEELYLGHITDFEPQLLIFWRKLDLHSNPTLIIWNGKQRPYSFGTNTTVKIFYLDWHPRINTS